MSNYYDLLRDWMTQLLGPSMLAILVATIVALSLPLLLHLYIYRSTGSTNLPTFLLVGPSGSGKTALTTHLERGVEASTHTSQAPLTVEVSLPVSTETASSRYRSSNDPTLQAHKRLLVIDTPGHGKLRHHALERMGKPHHLKGIIFLVDAASLGSGSGAQAGGDGRTEAAEYLHDVLLLLQRRSTTSTTSKTPGRIPVLIAANKADLFTALPAALVRSTLEREVTKVRDFRSKGLLDSGVSMGDVSGGVGEEREPLGGGGGGGGSGAGPFEFSQLEEFNVAVDVRSGNVLGSDGGDLHRWWEWIGDQL
ncbi:MAG: hypothetical protein M1837_001018 [Sclerophora amabilis]|nr:MAG: hypothetical protein M1837_001018 [Sclerophora amabilis]